MRYDLLRQVNIQGRRHQADGIKSIEAKFPSWDFMLHRAAGLSPHGCEDQPGCFARDVMPAFISG